MHVRLSERVKIILKTQSRDERKKVHTWFDYLRNWEENEVVRSRSVALDVQGQLEYMFRTTTELRIFFTVDLRSKTVSILDLATRDTILSFGSVPTGGS